MSLFTHSATTFIYYIHGFQRFSCVLNLGARGAWLLHSGTPAQTSLTKAELPLIIDVKCQWVITWYMICRDGSLGELE